MAAPVRLALVSLAVVGLLLVPAGGFPSRPAAVGGTGIPPRDLPAFSAQGSRGPTAPAVVGGDWTNLTGRIGNASPPARVSAGLAYDAADAEWVLFGGCGAVCPMNDTWAFANGGWINLTRNGPAPEARRSAMMTYDANAGGVLLFGGADAANADLNSTWLFKDGSWTNVSYLGGDPAPRRIGMLVFDPDPAVNGSVLFGGCFAVGLFVACLNDTWIWAPGSGWTMSPSGVSPPGRGEVGATYDPSARAIVMFGGFQSCSSSICTPNDVWEYYGGSWWPLNVPSTAPSGRFAPVLAYDARLAGDVLFGGLNLTTGNDTTDTWLYAHGNWTMLNPSASPAPRSGAVLASDARGNAPLLFGGSNDASGATDGDTWVFGGAPSASLAGVPPTVEVGVPTTWIVNVSGGAPPYAVSAAFGDGDGAHLSGDGPSFTFAHTLQRAGNLSTVVTVSDEVGLSATIDRSIDAVPGPSVSIGKAAPGADVGVALQFTALLVGSWPWGPTIPPWAFVWNFSDGAIATGADPNVSHVFRSSGVSLVQLTATDPLGGSEEANLSILVAPVPVVGIVASSAIAGSAAVFSANLTGGTAPFSYAWRFGDGSGGSSPSPSHTYATSGRYAVSLWVNDSAGGSASAHLELSVSSPSSGGGPSSSASSTAVPSWYWVALALIVAGAIGASYLVIRRRRR